MRMIRVLNLLERTNGKGQSNIGKVLMPASESHVKVEEHSPSACHELLPESRSLPLKVRR